MASAYFHRTMDLTSNSGYAYKWVFSAWVKRSSLTGSGNQNPLFSINQGTTNNNRVNVSFNNNDNLWCEIKDSSGTDDAYQETVMKFRDLAAWYHVYIKYDGTQSTALDRLQFYVNGQLQEVAYVNSPSSNFQQKMNSDMDWRLGLMRSNSGSYYTYDGLMSHVHFTDYGVNDTPAAVTEFGETDSTTGEWKIKTEPSITYNSQGLFVLKDNNLGTDQSGQGNNITVSGTCTKTEDNPSNVFCTYNKLQQTNSSAGFENGSTYFTNGTQWLGVNGTIAATSGKYYAEFKVTGSTGWGVGVADVDSDANRTDYLSSANNGYQSKYTGGKQIFLNGSTIVAQENNSTVVNNAGMGNTSFANNDIVMVALDLDNNNLFFGKNGTWLRGATESEIEAGTSTNATFSGTSFNNKFWTWSVCTELENMRMNAGNGYFSTTAVSSAGTNASGIGIFEYDVPDGFTALSTKGLNL